MVDLVSFKYKCTNLDCTECGIETTVDTTLSNSLLGTTKVLLDFRLVCVCCGTEMSREMSY